MGRAVSQAPLTSLHWIYAAIWFLMSGFGVSFVAIFHHTNILVQYSLYTLYTTLSIGYAARRSQPVGYITSPIARAESDRR